MQRDTIYYKSVGDTDRWGTRANASPEPKIVRKLVLEFRPIPLLGVAVEHKNLLVGVGVNLILAQVTRMYPRSPEHQLGPKTLSGQVQSQT